jgi:hypothetical protein
MSVNGKCPLCKAPALAEHAPFCSRACRDRDLLNWLGDAYRMPVSPEEEDGRERDDGGD